MNCRAPILLVEDDGSEIEVAVRAIRRAGLDVPVEVARDGQAALELLGLDGQEPADGAVRPRVVFLDLNLPRVDGWEVLRRLREHSETASVPVVIVSSSDEREDVRRSYALGANSFLVKHFDYRAPGKYLAEAAHYWLELNEPPPRKGSPDGEAHGPDRR